MVLWSSIHVVIWSHYQFDVRKLEKLHFENQPDILAFNNRNNSGTIWPINVWKNLHKLFYNAGIYAEHAYDCLFPAILTDFKQLLQGQC